MSTKTEEQLDKVIALLNQSVAIQLYEKGCSMEQIGKHLHIAKATVVQMLKGVKVKNNGKD